MNKPPDLTRLVRVPVQFPLFKTEGELVLEVAGLCDLLREVSRLGLGVGLQRLLKQLLPTLLLSADLPCTNIWLNFGSSSDSLCLKNTKIVQLFDMIITDEDACLCQLLEILDGQI